MSISIVVRGHTILPRLNASSLVLDFGANLGEFAKAISAKYNCNIYSLEPNPDLFAKLVETDKIKYLNCALTAADGMAEFEISKNCEASSLVATPKEGIGSVKVKTVSLDTLLKEIGAPEKIDLAKFDIEGAEVEVLNSISVQTLLRFKQLTIEFHDFANYVSEESVHKTISRLKHNGFLAFKMSKHTHGDMLFINSNLLPLTKIETIRVEKIEKATRGIVRIVKRRFKKQFAR